jgi:hypothetical protein
MKQITSHILAAALVVGVGAASAAAQGAAGDWELTIAAPQGANAVNLSLKLDGDKASGQLSSQLGTVPITGTSTGGAVALKASIDIQGMSLAMGIDGKVDGDTMAGNVTFGDFGEFPFTGKRASRTAATPPVAGAAPAAHSGVSGKRDLVLTIEGIGALPATAELKQDGDTVSGTLISMIGSVPVAGTLTRNALTLDFSTESPAGPMKITMTGELSADGLKGKASIAGVGEAAWTARRSAQ